MKYIIDRVGLENLYDAKILKPKTLVWKDIEYLEAYKAFDGKYVIEKIRQYEGVAPIYRIYFCGNILADRDLLNDAKQFCQDHHDNMFWSMIEV